MGGGGLISSSSLLSWRGVLSEVRGRTRWSQRPKAKKDPVYLFNARKEDIKRRGRGKLSCIWSASSPNQQPVGDWGRGRQVGSRWR